MTTQDILPVIRGSFEAVEAVCKDRVNLQEKLKLCRNYITEIAMKPHNCNGDPFCVYCNSVKFLRENFSK